MADRPTHILLTAGDLRTLCGRSTRDALPVIVAEFVYSAGSGLVVCPDCDIELALLTTPPCE